MLDVLLPVLKAGVGASLVAITAAQWELGIAAGVAIAAGLFTLRLQMFRLVKQDRDEWRDHARELEAKIAAKGEELATAKARIEQLEKMPNLEQHARMLTDIADGLKMMDTRMTALIDAAVRAALEQINRPHADSSY